MKRASAQPLLGRGMQKKRHTTLTLRLAAGLLARAHLADDLLGRGQRQEVHERAVADLAGERAASARAARRRTIGIGSARRRLELEAAGAALAGEHGAQHRDRLAHARQRLLERDARSSARRSRSTTTPRPSTKRPPLASASAAAVLGEQRRPARVRVDDAGAEPHALGPRGGERERGEAVGAVGLAGPQVVVAERPRRAAAAARDRRSGTPANGMVRPQRDSRHGGHRIGSAPRCTSAARRGEIVAVVGGLLLAVCLFLPWYETDPDNPNAPSTAQRGDAQRLGGAPAHALAAAAPRPSRRSSWPGSSCASTSCRGRAAR